MPAVNKTAEAFKENFNLLGIAGLVTLSAITVNPLPLLVGLVAEAAYLLFVPDSAWFDRRLADRYDAEVVARRERLKAEVFPSLSESIRERFMRLEAFRAQIGDQKHDGKRHYREVLRKLDYLMEKFLLFASKELQFRSYLRAVLEELDRGSVTVWRKGDQAPKDKRRLRADFLEETGQWVRESVANAQDAYDEEVETIRTMLETEENLHNQAVLEKRKDILFRRRTYVGRIGEILTNLTHQLSLIEDTFGLINDEIRARSPEQVLVDIEDVVHQSESLTETLMEVAPFEVMPVEDGAEKLYNVG
jgi:gas vesicle protein